MVFCIDHQSWRDFGGLMAANFRLRYRMNIERQCCAVQRFKGMEYDAFDTPAAAHLVWMDAAG